MSGSATRTPSRLELEDQRSFLEASLADAAREHEAGDLSDEDYSVLRRRDEARLEDVTELLATCDTATSEPPTPRAAASGAPRRPLVLVLAGTALVVIAAVVLVVHLTGQRLPGQTSSGSIQLSQAQRIDQELEQADTLLGSGDTADATTLYGQVLAQDPHDPAALAQLGWLTYEDGVVHGDTKAVTDGRGLVGKAIAADPRFGPAHLYEGVILLDTDHDAAGAVTQFRLFMAEHPSAQNLKNGAPFIRQAYSATHTPLPAGVPAM